MTPFDRAADHRNLPRALFAAGALCALAAHPAPALAGSAITPISNFNGTGGANPEAGLIADAAGVLYGTTHEGGNFGDGTVFKLTPPPTGMTKWTRTVLHHFHGTPDGANPRAALVMGPDGVLYGTAPFGGHGGVGTVFALTPPTQGQVGWTFHVLHQCSVLTGANPLSSLVLDAAGALYGTYNIGANDGVGTGAVFKLSPPLPGQTAWRQTALYSFGAPGDGSYPAAGVAFDSAGALYGTTTEGGTARDGTVFKLSPPGPGKTKWTENILHSFTGGADGLQPNTDLLVVGTNDVYGTTETGGIGPTAQTSNLGIAYRLQFSAAAGWTETILHTFTGGSDGASPSAGLTLASGALYGVTGIGGSAGFGTLYRLTPPVEGQTAWTETVLASFDYSTQGGEPSYARLLFLNAALYGTTYEGGLKNDGTVFRFPL